MGNHVSTDAVPFTLEDVAHTQQELCKGTTAGTHHPSLSPRLHPSPLPLGSTGGGGGSGTTPTSGEHGGSGTSSPVPPLPGDVIDRFDGIDHNIKAFRLHYRPVAPQASGAGAGGGSNPGPPSPASSSNVHNDPVQLTNPAATANAPLGGSRRGSAVPGAAGDRRGTGRTTPRSGYSPAVAGSGVDIAVSNHIRVDPFSLSAAHVQLRATDVYLVIHVQRLPASGATPSTAVPSVNPSMNASPISPLDDLTPRAPPTSCVGGRQWAEDTERYGPDRTPPWATVVADVVTPRGLSVPFASDIGKPVVSLYGSSTNNVNSPLARSPRSPPPTGDRTGEFQYSVHLLTGKRAHPLTAAVAVLHALQVERRFSECPELARRLFFNCNLARVPTAGGGAPSSVSTSERSRVSQLLSVTRPVPVGQLVVEGSEVGSGGAPGGNTTAAAVSFASPPLQECYSRNALLRLFHSVRVMARSPRLSGGNASGPTSSRYSIGSSPRGGGTGYPLRTPTPTMAITNNREPVMQGPPALEIPKLRTSIMPPLRPDSRRGASHGQANAAGADSAAPPAGDEETKHRATPSKSTKAARTTPKKAEGRTKGSGKAAAETASSESSSQQRSLERTLGPAESSIAKGHANVERGDNAEERGDLVKTSVDSTAGPSGSLPTIADLRLGDVLPKAGGGGAGGKNGRTPRRAGGSSLASKGSSNSITPSATTNTDTTLTPLPLMGLSRPASAPVEGYGGQEEAEAVELDGGAEGWGNSNGLAATTSGSERSASGNKDIESNETAMAEDRVQRLRQAAPEVTEVLPWLFVGGEEAAKDRQQLLAKGITAVVNTVAFDLPNYHDDVFRYQALYVCDAPDEPIFSLFPVVNRFIDEEKEERDGKVFIHCHQGVSRSCSFVIAYVMWKLGMCYDRAYELVRRARRVCSPNTGFYVNLHLWEDQLVKPVFNKAYAYVPYSPSYAFPFSFRLALTFRKSTAVAYDDEDAKVINPYTQIVEEGGTCVLDTRVLYGFILGERPATASTKAAPLYSFSYGGRRCDPVISQRAQQEWLSFVNYSFYQGHKTVSVNDRGESLNFVPLAALDSHSFVGTPTSTANHGGSSTSPGSSSLTTGAIVVASALDPADVVRRVGKHLFAPSASASVAFTAKEERFDLFEPLFKHEKLIFKFAMQLEEEGKAKVAEETRKRAREEELRRRFGNPNSNYHLRSLHSPCDTFSDGSRTAKSIGSNSNNGTARPQPLASSSTRVASPPSEPHTGVPSPRPQIMSAGGDTRRPNTSPACGGTRMGSSNENNNLSSSTSGNTRPMPFLNLKLSGSGSVDGSQVAAALTGVTSLPPITEVTILRYPFTEGAMQANQDGCSGEDEERIREGAGDDENTAAILIEDLDPQECYAVVVPDTGAGKLGNRVYLWMGADCELTRKEVWQAFYSHLASKSGPGADEEDEWVDEDDVDDADGPVCVVQVPGKRPLTNVIPTVVVGGDEPDELLLVM